MNGGEIFRKLTELYEEVVVTKARYESLEKVTNDTIAQFRSAVLRFEESCLRMERDHIRERAEMQAKVDALSARLDALSESALHAVAREAARDVLLAQAEAALKHDGQDKRTLLPPATSA